MTPNEAMAQALHDAGECHAGPSGVRPCRSGGDTGQFHASQAPRLLDALTSAGYALVPVKEALTVERIAEALHRADVSCEYADDGEGGAVCVYRRHPEDAVAFLAALDATREETL